MGAYFRFFEDRIERLGAERFDGEDERALLILGAQRHCGDDSGYDGESRHSRDLPEHAFLPYVDCALFFLELS